MAARSLRPFLPALATVAIGALAGCGGGEEPRTALPTPPTAMARDFPKPGPGGLPALRRELGPGLELAPGTAVHEPGRSRFGFALFDRARRALTGAPAAVYLAGAGGRVAGPFPARSESLTVRPPFRSRGVASDPDAPASLYVAELDAPRSGPHQLMAVVRLDDRLVASDPIDVRVRRDSPVPEVGELAPKTSTPTVASTAGATDLLDTRDPPGTMHDEDFADVVGRRPALLLFATPALCESRVCGPVVDVAEQVKAEHDGDTAFVHMEIYEQNRVESGLRPQVRQWRLPTEPWAFAVDRRGRIAARLEGAFSARELEDALARAREG